MNLDFRASIRRALAGKSVYSNSRSGGGKSSSVKRPFWRLTIFRLALVFFLLIWIPSCKKDSPVEKGHFSETPALRRSTADSLILAAIRDSLTRFPTTRAFISELGTLQYDCAAVFESPGNFTWVQIPIFQAGAQEAGNIFEIFIDSLGLVQHKLHSKRYYEIQLESGKYPFAKEYHEEMLAKFQKIEALCGLESPVVTYRTEEMIFLQFNDGTVCSYSGITGQLVGCTSGGGGSGSGSGCFDHGGLVAVWQGGALVWSAGATGASFTGFVDKTRFVPGWNISYPSETGGGGGGNGTPPGVNPNNVQYEDIHVLNKAKARLKATYGLDIDINLLIWLFGKDCILELGNRELPAGIYYAESDCIEEVLAENNMIKSVYLNAFKNDCDIKIPLEDLMGLTNNSCPPLYGYDVFADCVKDAILNDVTANNPEITLSGEERNWLKGDCKMLAKLLDFIQEHPGQETIAKQTLEFVKAHRLTVSQFEFLLLNNAVFEQIKSLTGELALTNAQIGWLIDNGQEFVLGQITNFVQNNTLEYEQSVKEAVHVHLQLLMADPEYVQLNQEATGWPVWMWEIFGEVLVEVGINIVQKQLGLTIGDDVKDAIKSCGSGDLLACLGNTVDVLRRFFPALKFIDLALDLAENSGKVTKVGIAIDKLQNFGGDFVTKVVTLVKTKTGGNLLDSFKWKNADTGVEVFNIGNPQSFWNDFKSMFPDITGPYPNPNNPETYKVLGNTIEIQYYTTSGTTGGPTIKASIGGYLIKFRLQ